MRQLSPESEQANRFQLVSRMADDLAHEIKNPLNSMVINIEVLRSRVRKGDVEGALDRASVLESEVLRLNGLIDGLLKLMRPGRPSLDGVPVDPLLEELGALVGLQAKLARKELTVGTIGETAVTRGPRDAVRFALLNIFSAELAAITGDEARIDVGGTTGPAGTTVRIESASSDQPGTNGERDDAVEIARALLHPMGGTVVVEMDPDSGTRRVVSVELPAVRLP